MATITGTEKNFESIMKQQGITLVDFWAEWCGPCKRFGPIFDKASESHEDVNFVKVDTDHQQALAQSANIQSIPTIMGIKDGYLVFSHSGAMSEKDLNSLIEQIRNVDTSNL